MYAYFLGGIYALTGGRYLAARLVQALLGSLNCLLVYLLAARVFGRREAVIASLIAAA